MRLVLDTQVWLDWLVFGDPCVVPLRDAVARGAAQVLIDAPCEAELERVLGYRLGRRVLAPERQRACLAECRRIARRIGSGIPEHARAALPQCRDADDQKFLEAALAARASALVTKDLALLELARRRLPFRIATPQALELP